MRRALVFSLLACALLAGAGPTFAQDRTGTFEISPFGGGYFGSELYESGRGVVEVQSDWAYGVRLAYNVNRFFGIEFDWTHAQADLEGHRFASVPGFPAYPSSGRIGSFKQDVYEANAIFNFGKRRAVGYFGIGAGAAVIKAEFTNASSSSETRFTGSLSGGFKGFVTPRFGFRFDGRLRYTDTERATGSGTYCDYYGYCYHYVTTWYYSGELTGGLIFAF